MRDLEAKDFLVRQTAEQATLENVPLSELERRMMYFTETGECPEDPIALSAMGSSGHSPVSVKYIMRLSSSERGTFSRVACSAVCRTRKSLASRSRIWMNFKAGQCLRQR